MTDPASPSSPTSASTSPPRAHLPSPIGAARSGAALAARLVTFLIWPVAVALAIAGLAPTGLGIGSGYGFGIHRYATQPLVVYLVCLAVGAALGGVLGLAVGLGRWARRGRGATRPVAPIRRLPGEAEPPPPAPPLAWARPRRGWLWWFALEAVAVAALSVVLGAVVGPAVRSKLDRAIAEADRSDPAWRLDALLADRGPGPLGDASSRAVAEVYAAIPPGWLEDPALAPGAPPGPSPFLEAADRLDRLGPGLPIDDESLKVLAEGLEAHRGVVDRALALASVGPGFHRLKATPNPLDLSLAETVHARVVARLLEVEAAVDARSGRGDGAIEAARAILGVARSIGPEPTMASSVIRSKIDAMAVEAARRALDYARPSAEALERLQRDMQAELAEPLLLRGIEGERATVDELIRRIRDGELPIEALQGGAARPDDPPPPVPPWARLAFDHQRALALEWNGRGASIARKPPGERAELERRLSADILAESQKNYANLSATIPLLMAPALGAGFRAEGRRLAELGAAVVLVAAARQRIDRGNWPDSAQAIDPSILDRPPLDPFSGKPFLLDRSGGRVRVRSVGPNLRDDAGLVSGRDAFEGGADDFGTSVAESPD